MELYEPEFHRLPGACCTKDPHEDRTLALEHGRHERLQELRS
jgi:hypothetical protein